MDGISQAREGDGDAFRRITEPHLHELQVHCYRMLGSFQDAEDAVQDTLMTAWQALAGFEERASLRTWLYRIATNRCLNLLRTRGRRPVKEWDIPGVTPPEPTRRGEVVWLEPYPDALMGPEARAEQSESISLAFVTALQTLPPRQVAVLILRDVLGFPAREVADILESTVESVTSALKRARAGLSALRSRDTHEPAPAPDSVAERTIVARFVVAYESGDLDALVELLTDDVFMSMPPMSLEYIGPELVGEFCALLFGAGREYQLVPTRANGQPALGSYVRTPDGSSRATGLFVLAIDGEKISAMTRFESSVLASFGLPLTR